MAASACVHVTLHQTKVFPEDFAMSNSIPLSIKPEDPTAFPARWGFVKGVVVGAVVEVPVIAGLLWLVARCNVGDPTIPMTRLLRLTAVFAGTAAILTAGGIGRLAAHASAVGGRPRAALVGARTHAVASLGLMLIAALPHRHLPTHLTGWLLLLGSGAVAGAATGAALGLVCSGPAPVGISDVVALARTPGHALQQLIDPDDLRQFGAALRHRTGHLLTGMFEPVEPPPGADLPMTLVAPDEPAITAHATAAAPAPARPEVAATRGDSPATAFPSVEPSDPRRDG